MGETERVHFSFNTLHYAKKIHTILAFHPSHPHNNMLGISQFPVIPDYSVDILDKNRQNGHQPHLRQDSTSPNRHLEINLIKQQ